MTVAKVDPMDRVGAGATYSDLVSGPVLEESPPRGKPSAARLAEIDTSVPFVLWYAGSSFLRVRTRDACFVDCDQRVLRAELRRQGYTDVLFEGKRKVGGSELLESYGRRCDDTIFDHTIDRDRYEPSDDGGGTLYLAPLERPTIPAVYHRDVAEWLGLLFGDAHERGLDWLASMWDLRSPTSGLLFYGPKGTGKQMIAAAIGRYFGRNCVLDYAKAIGRFNGEMATKPVIFLDEGDDSGSGTAAAFKRLIGNTEHAIEKKHRPVATKRGAVRLVIGANDLDALGLRDDMTPETQAAIGDRLLLIEIPRHDAESSPAAQFLEGLGGKHGQTRDWVEDPDTREPGKIPQHIQWLRENRRVKPDGRFLVTGNGHAWIASAARRGGLGQEVLAVLARCAAGATSGFAGERRPVEFRRGEALVSPDRLHRAWERLSGDRKTPNLRALADTLATLGSGRSQATIGDRRVRVIHIPADRIIDAAEFLGIGDDEAIRNAFDHRSIL